MWRLQKFSTSWQTGIALSSGGAKGTIVQEAQSHFFVLQLGGAHIILVSCDNVRQVERGRWRASTPP